MTCSLIDPRYGSGRGLLLKSVSANVPVVVSQKNGDASYNATMKLRFTQPLPFTNTPLPVVGDQIHCSLVVKNTGGPSPPPRGSTLKTVLSVQLTLPPPGPGALTMPQLMWVP